MILMNEIKALENTYVYVIVTPKSTDTFSAEKNNSCLNRMKDWKMKEVNEMSWV